MNTENDKQPNDEQLSNLYGQTGREQPPAHLNDAILAAARRETASRPHPAYSPFSNNWRVPVSLAAVLVLSIGLVNLMDDEVTPALDESDVLLSQLDGYVPAIVEETEVSQPPLETEGKVEMAQGKRQLANAPAEPARTIIAESVPRDDRQKADEDDAGRLALRAPSLAKSASKPAAKVAPASAPESADTGLGEGLLARQLQENKKREQFARKEKQESLADTSDRILPVDELSSGASALSSNAPARASIAAPVPTVEDIMALREAGNLEQAGKAADSFIRHHFGEDLDKVDPMQVKLPIRDWGGFVAELRKLDRKEQADKLDRLMRSKHEQGLR